MVLEGEGAKQRLVAVAHYSDGTMRDVSNLAAFTTNNERSAAVTAEGAVTAACAAKRSSWLASIRIRWARKFSRARWLKYTPPEVTGNYIDQLVGDKLQKLRMLPSGICTDEEFLRRATIDIVGCCQPKKNIKLT